MGEVRQELAASLLERVVAGEIAEHAAVTAHASASPLWPRAALVGRVLAGERVDEAQLGYALAGAWHLGVVAQGPRCERVLRSLAERLALAALVLPGGDGCVWGWLGARAELPVPRIEALLGEGTSAERAFAIGSPAYGVDGFARSHEQARAAQRVAAAHGERVTRCCDVAIAAALAASPLLADVLLDTYLAPLDRLGIGRQAACATLAAYVECECQLSSAASRLGMSRQGLEKRIHRIEAAIGRPLGRCAGEVKAALCVEALRVVVTPPPRA